jgi:GNAT superfamily N-acetyltransferase
MMTGPIAVEMMSAEALLWRCLHGGSLTAASVDAPGPDGSVPFRSFRARNLSFLRNVARTYGASAVVATRSETIVGHLRFYPKAVRELAAPAIGLCLQQEFPGGPADDLGRMRLPPLAEIADKTLFVHCMMVAPDGLGGDSLRRRGIGRRMAERLVEWAGANGWRAIEATAYRRAGAFGSPSASGSPGRGASPCSKRRAILSGPCANRPPRWASTRPRSRPHPR